MYDFDASHPPRLARLLGFAGLIPFVSAALGIWLTPLGWRPFVLSALLDYAAVILAFMGAIHWGLAMRAGPEDTRTQMQLGLSVIPALVGWVVISVGLPAGLAVVLFILAFIGLYLADLRSVRLGLAPRWYPALRLPLTFGVVTSLLVAWGGLMLVQPG
ncbi:DUF3429 domain-containing protein [Metapseudomonas furukawaii]|jgi:hypothetical protein|uniref:Uncharacterized protein n=1 Tax=Metapseudomonas furukawaii TaxID=1149133 RepID=L8MRB7_METFU|nr:MULTISPECIES: DUF3429 domain-containing protein [Pseudomonas]ELS27542.1 Hypothetical protein ppKF707_1457 [Pseudomonas furukawaii]ELS29040.1 Hypothetical protein ppKF707_4031 [Pseudomonas furukawaii]OWJ97488.1 DUF3429 domain-containing protein [Pseudomonas sp. A46]BAU73816.1 conserved hypothetical protein [Pseudomonas furukawaii]